MIIGTRIAIIAIKRKITAIIISGIGPKNSNEGSFAFIIKYLNNNTPSINIGIINKATFPATDKVMSTSSSLVSFTSFS